jgi:gamma-tubulin complex component 3
LTIPAPIQELADKLCEMGWLYLKIQARIAVLNTHESMCLCEQSLFSEIKKEMHDYYRLIAILQTHCLSNSIEQDLSLKRLYVWVAQPLARMRVVNVLLEVCKGI